MGAHVLGRIESGTETKWGKNQLFLLCDPFYVRVSKPKLVVVSFLLTSPSPFYPSSRVSGFISDFCKNSPPEMYDSRNLKCMQRRGGEGSGLW